MAGCGTLPSMHETLYLHARIWSGMSPSSPGEWRPDADALVERGGRIVAVGEGTALRRAHPSATVVDLGGRLLTPGLIDCHTHIVYAGNRSAEIDMRLAGRSYAEIARAGGGILSTVRATRAADEAALLAATLPRVDALIADGLTTIEVKSGYALEPEGEMRMLRVARMLATQRAIGVRTTFLGAHAVAPEFGGDAEAHIEALCRDWLPRVAASGLADAFDGFLESIAFSEAQMQRAFAAARAAGLPVKLHADQLTNGHGAALAAAHGALSADHLEYTDAAGVAALAASGTVAVLLPGAFHFLREKQLPPVAALRAAGVPMAVSTDCNPGTSPLASLLTAMNLAAVDFGLTAHECLAGTTTAAARALGLAAECGSLAPGKWCDLAAWDVAAPSELVHALGTRPLHLRAWHGTRGAQAAAGATDRA